MKINLTKLLCIGIILIISIALWTRKITVGGFSWSDAPIHAMDGVFVYDFISSFPIEDAKDWAYRYYAKYPCLGLIVFYPPLYPLVEAGMYFLLGISVFAARMTVVLFGVLGATGLYLLLKELFDDNFLSILLALVWITLPSTVNWATQVMLEVPTTSMIILSAYFYLRFRGTQKVLWWVLMWVFVLLAFLTKQWSVFIIPVFVVDYLIAKRFKGIDLAKIIIGVISLLLIFLYIHFTGKVAYLSKLLVKGEVPWKHITEISTWFFYLKSLPEVVGWLVLILTVAGVICIAVKRKFVKFALPLFWFVVFYLFATVIWWKEVRYFYLITPSCVILIGGVFLISNRRVFRNVIYIVVLSAVVYQAVFAWFSFPRRLNNYIDSARFVSAQPDAKFVLVDAIRDGQFIFDLRRVQGKDGKVWVLRGSKLLYSRAARKRWWYEEYVKSEEDILEIIRKYHIRYVVVEDRPPDHPNWREFFLRPSLLLRNLLKESRLFKEVYVQPVSVDDVIWRRVNLKVYRYVGRFDKIKWTISIPIPAMGGEIRLPLE